MANTRGVFSLRKLAEEKIPLNEWVDLDNVWHSPSPGGAGPETGYFGGGLTSNMFPTSTKMDKLTYSNDTSTFTPSANSVSGKYTGASFGNTTHGFIAGGKDATETSQVTVEKTTYASDSTAAVPSGANISPGERQLLAGTGNNAAGYIAGGGGPNLSIVDKITYSTDTTARVPGANLSVARYGMGATSSSDAGYFGGGTSPAKSTMDKLTYSTDTTAEVPGAALSLTKMYLTATGNSTHGYFGGGGFPPSSVMDKLTYSTDSTENVSGANLSAGRYYLSATGNQSAGYFSGGGIPGPSPSGTLSTTEKTTYSSDTTAAVPGANLSEKRRGHGGFSGAANALGAAPSAPATRFSDGVEPTVNFGYFAGGGGGLYSTVDKTTFADDTTAAVPGANLSPVRKALGGVGSLTAAYFIGGNAPSTSSNMQKTTYATDTTADVPGANLSGTRYNPNAVGNSTNGYIVGGHDGFGTTYTTVDKLTYSTDTVSALSAELDTGRAGSGSTGNLTEGYFAGGGLSPGGDEGSSSTEKITYSSDTMAVVPGANLSEKKEELSATGNSTHGFFGGGRHSPGPGNRVTTVDKITYSDETIAAVPGAALSQARSRLASTGNSTAGYFGGGGTPSDVSTMDKTTYSTDTTAYTPGANLSQTRQFLAGASGREGGMGADPPTATPTPATTIGPPSPVPTPNTGFFAGGGNPGDGSVGAYVSVADKTDFSNDTTAASPSANLSTPRTNSVGNSSLTHGYFGGGRNGPGGDDASNMDKLNYSNDTTAAAPSTNLTAARKYHGGAGNSTHGYFAGGKSPGTVATMEKTTYATDTTATVPSDANLSASRYALAGTGNTTAGYFGGGFPGGVHTTAVDKLTYSTDTTARVPGADLSYARMDLGATGNSDAGYFGGGRGWPSQSTMDKLTYSDETTAQVPGASLSIARNRITATGNSAGGYFAGGTGQVSTVDKVTYSSDTTAAVPGAALSQAKYRVGSVSPRQNVLPTTVAPQSPNTGYYAGGQTVGTLVDKTDFTTDTTVAVPGASFTVGSPADRHSRLATGNSTAGYFAGGTSPGDGTTVMEKITYSSDTPSAVSGANLSTRRYGGGAVGNNDFGYFGGGQSGGTNLSTMDKCTYSTETTAEVPGAPLSNVRYRVEATGNSTVGYFAGGSEPGNRSTIDKLTYATDTLATNPASGSLTVDRNGVAAFGDSDKGYFAGGGIRSMVDKLTYSNDTCAQVPGADMSVARMVAAAASNSSAGYIGGGSAPSHGGTTTMMDKLTYSDETCSAVPGAGLSAARGSLSATGARSYAIPALPPVPIPNII